MGKERPSGVPPEAVWSEEDTEWVLGPRDPAGEYHGLVNYWRPDGTLCCICPLVHGKPHGLSKRFHENGELSRTAQFVGGALHGLSVWQACAQPTTEKMHAPGMSEDISRAEADYEEGKLAEIRYYLASGERVNADGSAFMEPPDGVPESALFDPKNGQWVSGRWREDGKKQGLIRWWDSSGNLLVEETHDGDMLHGPVVHYYRAGGRKAETHYARGKLDGPCAAYRLDGTVARRAGFKNNRYHGLLEDLDEQGQLIRSRRFEDGRWADRAPAAQPADRTEPDEEPDETRYAGDPYGLGRASYTRPSLRPRMDDAEAREALDSLASGGPAAQATAAKVISAHALGPEAVAELIALGWTRDEDSDEAARSSRLARKLFGQLATRELWNQAVKLELAAMPRIRTEKRLRRIVKGLAGWASVDVWTLERHLLERSGLGISMSFQAGGERAERALEGAIQDKRLNLRRKDLNILPAEVGLFPHLEQIDLFENRLTLLPPEIGDVWKLAELDLGGNRISEIPVELSRLTDLRKLDLHKNGYTSLPPGLERLTGLTVLNLSYNDLTSLPDEIGRLSELDHLWLNDNPLKDLPTGFAELAKLRFLHLGDANLEEIPRCLFELEDLEELWVASPSFRFLSPEIKRIKRLRRLIFWYSQVESLPEELFSMTGLVEIRAGNNPLPEGTIDRLKEALPNCTIY